MEVTNIRIKLIEDPDERLHAFCAITIDGAFVVRDIKIIEGSNGPFVAMPSRRLSVHCHGCGYKNHLRAKFCNQCGTKSKGLQSKGLQSSGRKVKLYADIAHPINTACRKQIQERLLEALVKERELAKQPDYSCQYDEVDDNDTILYAPAEDEDTDSTDNDPDDSR